MDLVIFDLETTGLSPQRDEIIQIAAVRVRDGEIIHNDSFSTFVNPGISIPPFISNYTGIRNADVRHSPLVGEALVNFAEYVGSDVLAAHNGHRFDMPFIRSACERRMLGTRLVRYCDSLAFSRLLWGYHAGHGLDIVLQRLDISTSGYRRHDARADVSLLAKAVIEMWTMLYSKYEEPPVAMHHGVLPH